MEGIVHEMQCYFFYNSRPNYISSFYIFYYVLHICLNSISKVKEINITLHCLLTYIYVWNFCHEIWSCFFCDSRLSYINSFYIIYSALHDFQIQFQKFYGWWCCELNVRRWAWEAPQLLLQHLCNFTKLILVSSIGWFKFCDVIM